MTQAEEKPSPLVQVPSGLSQISLRSGSRRPFKIPSLPSLLPASGHSLSDVSRLLPLTADELLSCFAGQAFFDEYFADCVCTFCVPLYLMFVTFVVDQ